MRPVLNLDATRLRTSRMTNRLNDKAAEAYEAQISEMTTNSVIEHAPVKNTEPSLSDLKDKPHGGERIPYPKAKEIRSSRSIAASPASLRLLVRELGRGGRICPPPAGRVRLNTPAGRGLNLDATRLRTSRMTNRLNDKAAEAYEAQISEMTTNSVIEHAPVKNTEPSLSDLKDKPHGGERIPYPKAKEIREENMLPHADAKGGSTNQGGEPIPSEPTERRFPPRDGSGIAPASVLGSPLEDDPTSAFYLPHRGIHRNGKLRIVFDGSAKDGVGKSLNDYLDPGDNLLQVTGCNPQLPRR